MPPYEGINTGEVLRIAERQSWHLSIPPLNNNPMRNLMKPTQYVPRPRAHASLAFLIGLIFSLARILVDQLARHRVFTEYLVAGTITAMLISCIPWIGQLWPLSILIGAVVGLMRQFRNR